jgi:hypothetical protein
LLLACPPYPLVAGAGFDGRFVYFASHRAGASGVIARLDARTPPDAALPFWSGSFF